MEKKKQPDNTDPKLILKYLNQQITNNKLSVNEPLEYQEFIDRCKVRITQNNEDGIYIMVTNLWSITVSIKYFKKDFTKVKPYLELDIIPSMACNTAITYIWTPGSIFLNKLKQDYLHRLDLRVIECIKKLFGLHLSDDESYLCLPDKIEIED